jgi:hypothetical protein
MASAIDHEKPASPVLARASVDIHAAYDRPPTAIIGT